MGEPRRTPSLGAPWSNCGLVGGSARCRCSVPQARPLPPRCSGRGDLAACIGLDRCSCRGPRGQCLRVRQQRSPDRRAWCCPKERDPDMLQSRGTDRVRRSGSRRFGSRDSSSRRDESSPLGLDLTLDPSDLLLPDRRHPRSWPLSRPIRASVRGPGVVSVARLKARECARTPTTRSLVPRRRNRMRSRSASQYGRSRWLGRSGEAQSSKVTGRTRMAVSGIGGEKAPSARRWRGVSLRGPISAFT